MRTMRKKKEINEIMKEQRGKPGGGDVEEEVNQNQKQEEKWKEKEGEENINSVFVSVEEERRGDLGYSLKQERMSQVSDHCSSDCRHVRVECSGDGGAGGIA